MAPDNKVANVSDPAVPQDEENLTVDHHFLQTATWNDGDRLVLSVSGRWVDEQVKNPAEDRNAVYAMMPRFGEEVQRVIDPNDDRDLFQGVSAPVHVFVGDPLSDKLCISGSWMEGLLTGSWEEGLLDVDRRKLTPAAKALVQDFARKVRELVRGER